MVTTRQHPKRRLGLEVVVHNGLRNNSLPSVQNKVDPPPHESCQSHSLSDVTCQRQSFAHLDPKNCELLLHRFPQTGAPRQCPNVSGCPAYSIASPVARTGTMCVRMDRRKTRPRPLHPRRMGIEMAA